MKLSWSHKLFLRVNSQVGQRSWLDQFMIFCARWLIYIFIAVVIEWGWFWYQGEMRVFFFVSLAATLATAYAVSLTIGLLYQHQRPIKELPNVKTLVQTLGTWKSFPSDHTLVAFVMALMAILFGSPGWFGVILIVNAILIAVARVYTGVHYPRDVVGGVTLAAFFSIGSYFIVSYFS